MKSALLISILFFTRLVYAAPTLLNDMPLRYIAQPAAATGQPLVIFLHGYGADENDLFPIKERLPANYTYLSVRAPMRIADGKYQWFEKSANPAEYDGVQKDIDRSLSLLLEFIPKVAEKYHTKTRRVILIGFSQGAMMSYEAGLLHPDSVHALAALSGKLMPTLRPRLKPSHALERQIVFIGHGVSDTTIPYHAASEAKTILDKLGVKLTFHAYEGVQHQISDAELIDLRAWIDENMQ